MSAVARFVIAVLVGVTLAGCTALLVGGPRDTRGAEQVAVDNRIVSMVSERLARDELTRGADIAVSSTRSVVTLRGTVYGEAARQRAVDLARDVPDVSRVISLELTVR